MEKIWYYTRGDGEKFGPYTDEEIIRFIKQGILLGEDYLWMADFDEWVQISNSIYSVYLQEDTE